MISNVKSVRAVKAQASRRELISVMGGACQLCCTTQSLEFDCYPVPETSHHFMPSPMRIRFYWQQFRQRNLRLLCKSCHVRETAKMNSKFIGVHARLLSATPAVVFSVSPVWASLARKVLAASAVPFEERVDVPECTSASHKA